jgi:hypothetical protein
MNLSPFVVDQYDASSRDDRLMGLLLYPDAVLVHMNGDSNESSGVTTLRICTDCYDHLINRADAVPPQMSIANGNAIGRMPDQF